MFIVVKSKHKCLISGIIWPLVSMHLVNWLLVFKKLVTFDCKFLLFQISMLLLKLFSLGVAVRPRSGQRCLGGGGQCFKLLYGMLFVFEAPQYNVLMFYLYIYIFNIILVSNPSFLQPNQALLWTQADTGPAAHTIHIRQWLVHNLWQLSIHKFPCGGVRCTVSLNLQGYFMICCIDAAWVLNTFQNGVFTFQIKIGISSTLWMLSLYRWMWVEVHKLNFKVCLISVRYEMSFVVDIHNYL